MTEEYSRLEPQRYSIDRIHGCLAGGAIGDSLGLAFEGLNRKRGIKLLGNPYPNRLFFGYGMVSDDTEHACMTAIALINSNENPETFERELISQLRWWFLCLPPATGLATAKACLKSLMGISPKKIGSDSAGNGPAMRAAVIGCSAKSIESVQALIEISSRLTHSDRRSEEGALLIALAANWSLNNSARNVDAFFHYLENYRGFAWGLPFRDGIKALQHSLAIGESTLTFSEGIGSRKGVSGFIIPTTLVALHSWLANLNDFEKTVIDCIRCGGDTDTVAAIAGSLAGAYVGYQKIPEKLGKKIIDYPFSYKRLSLLAIDLNQSPDKTSNVRWIGKRWVLMPFRNLTLVFLIFLHVLRRIAPPY
jgi:ADP-ribosylglycohydrolase